PGASRGGRRHTVRGTGCSWHTPLLPDHNVLRGSRADRLRPSDTSLRPSYDGRMRSSGTSTRLTPLKLKSNSTRYIGGSAETRCMIVPGASCTFWLKATPLIVRPLRFTFTRWFGSNTPEPPRDHLRHCESTVHQSRSPKFSFIGIPSSRLEGWHRIW